MSKILNYPFDVQNIVSSSFNVLRLLSFQNVKAYNLNFLKVIIIIMIIIIMIVINSNVLDTTQMSVKPG